MSFQAPPGLSHPSNSRKKDKDNESKKTVLNFKPSTGGFRKNKIHAQKLLLREAKATPQQRFKRKLSEGDEPPKKKANIERMDKEKTNVIGSVRSVGNKGWQVRTPNGIILGRFFGSKSEGEDVLRLLQKGEKSVEDYQKVKKKKKKKTTAPGAVDPDDLDFDSTGNTDPKSQKDVQQRRERLLKWKQNKLEKAIQEKVKTVDLEKALATAKSTPEPKKDEEGAEKPNLNRKIALALKLTEVKTDAVSKTFVASAGGIVIDKDPDKEKRMKEEQMKELEKKERSKEEKRKRRSRSRDRRRRRRRGDRDRDRDRDRKRRRADRKRRVRGSESDDEEFKLKGKKEGKDAGIPATLDAEMAEDKDRSPSPFDPRFAFATWNPFTMGTRFLEKTYIRLNTISEGVYGVVHRCKEIETGDMMALKKIKLYKTQSGFPLSSLREIGILQDLEHPNIVKLREVVISEKTGDVFMAMEYCHNCLQDLVIVKRVEFSTPDVKSLMRDLLQGMDCMHKKWYLHRDLKTANLLYTNDGQLKICDYGMARQFGMPLAPYTNLVVTPWYRAPEILLGTDIYGPAIDMWSVGCIFAEIFTRRVLFHGKGELNQLELIFDLMGTPTLDSWPGIEKLAHWDKFEFEQLEPNFTKTFPVQKVGKFSLSKIGQDLLRRLLSPCPAKRLTAAQALEHDWFTEDPLPTPYAQMPKFDDNAAKERVENRPPPKPIEQGSQERQKQSNSAQISGNA